jgi:hypothetical protein
MPSQNISSSTWRTMETIEHEAHAINNDEAATEKFVDAPPEKVKAWQPQ